MSTGPTAPWGPQTVSRGTGPTAPRARGTIALLEPNCTSCMICARDCPDWCIHIESTTVQPDRDAAGRSRSRARPVLQRFAIDFASCLYCGICVDVCPFDALHWTPEHDYPGVDAAGQRAVAELLAERDVLTELVATVPPPVA